MNQCVTLEIPKGMKNTVSISVAFCLDFFLSEMKIYLLRNAKQKAVRNNITYKASYKPSKLGEKIMSRLNLYK